MRMIALLALLLVAQPAEAGGVLGFLFGSPPRHHHHHAYRHRHGRVHKTIVKKTIIIVRERKARAPTTMDRTPITPLK